MKNLFFFNQRSNAAAQATECAYTTGQKFGVNPTKTSTFGRFATYIGLVLVMLVTLGVGEMKADEYTAVVGVAATNGSDYTVKLNVNRKGDGDDWQQAIMSKAGITFEGKKLYITSYKNKYGGLGNMQFQYYSGSDYKGQKEPITSWTTSTHDNKIYNYDGSAWYSDQSMTNGARVYFDASTWSETGIKLVTGHANHQKYYSLSAVTNTKLYYGTNTDTWSDAMGFGIVGGTSRSGGNDQWLTDVSDKATEYTGWKNYGLTATSTNQAYLVVPGGNAGEQPTVNYYSTAYSSLNSTQTIKYAVGVNGGTPATLTSGYVPADIAISSYKFSTGKYNAVDASSGSVTLSQGGSNYSATVTAGRTATTTYTVSNIHEDYSFVGWYSAASEGTLLSSELSYTFYPTSATTAYARFSKENNHIVTISRYCTSTSSEINNTSAKIGEITYSSIEAPEIYGYTFVNWTLESGVIKHASDAVTANPIRVITAASGTYTLTANYTEVLTTDWKLIGDNTSNSPFGDNYSYASGKAMSKESGASATDKAYKTLNITKTGTWGFKVATASGNSNTYGWGSGSDYITFNRSKSGNKQDVYNGEQHELKFNPDGLGEYKFEIDYTVTPCSVKVTFPTVYTVTFGKGTGGNTVNATYSSTSFNSGTKVQGGKTVRFTQTASTGYQFKEWNTNSSGTGTQLSTNSSYYDRTIASTNNVYAIYDPKQYAIPLNDQDATTAVSPTSVNATYKSLTLSSAITNPEKNGYTFGGWYSAVGGGGYLIINTSGALQASKSGYTDGSGWTRTSGDNTVYAKWTQVLTLDKNGGSTDGGLTVIYKKTATSGHTAATRTGYTLTGYYDATSGGNKIINANGSLVSYSVSVSSYIRTDGSWGYNGTPTLYAQWTANSYDVTLKPNGATTGSDQVVRAIYDSSMPTSTKSSAALVAPTKTGYTLQGFYQNSNGTGTKYYNANMTSATSWDQAGNANIWAKWQANNYTVTLDVDEANQGNIASATTSQSVTYDAATTTVPSRPTAANGYGLEGYFTDHNGGGTKVINGDGTWIASVTGYTDADKKWVHDGDVTLYAYYKKAEITALTFVDAIVAQNVTNGVKVTPTISPTPAGTTHIDWRVLYSNGNPLAEQPSMSTYNTTGKQFTSPATSGTYLVEAVLRTGSTANAGTTIDSTTASFQVAGEHTVTIRYQDSESNTLQASANVTARPLAWSDDITAPTIFGYTFTRWDAGDGVTIKDGTGEDLTTSTSLTIKIKATYDGRLTAVYTQNQMIYFKNTLGWSDVYVNFYTSSYWNNPKGSGNKGKSNCNKHMTRIGETDVWYYDYGAASITPSLYVSFTSVSQENYENFSNANVVYPANYQDDIHTDKSAENGFKAAVPMFVPLADQAKTTLNSNANYYNRGYWTKYLPGTGYTLEIYNSTGSSLLKSIEFTSADELMPMKAVADLEAATTYTFQIRRGGTESNGIYYGNTGSMSYTDNGQGTPWALTHTMEPFTKVTIKTTAAGDYTYNLSYSANASSQYRLRIAVDYPAATGDFQVLYSDTTTWSNGQHAAAWRHPSRVITARANGKDTISFFVAKNKKPAINARKISEINASTGAITWTATNIGSNSSQSLDDVEATGVYNFVVTQNAAGTAISSVENIGEYTGNYYIRTDAANNKWDSYRAIDHQITYSEYAKDYSDYTHYFMAHVGSGTNIKFVIANDFSACVSDTLIRQTYRGGDASHVDTDGKVQAEANVRFMYDLRYNRLTRAYLAAAKSDGSNFLVLRANSSSDMMDANGNALLNSANYGEAGYNHKAPDNSIQFVDNENWIYETDIKIQPGAFVKLYAYFNSSYFYYKGTNDNTFDGSHAINLMTGVGDPQLIRVIYDFKTDRLVAAWTPSGEIDGERAINADVMFVREHQGDIAQITFTESGKITKINTAYGVLRFNKWTLNNKSKADGHAPLSPALSRYERDLFYVSFPFTVAMNEVFGFGKYGQHWIIEEYDGAGRAANGFWADSPSYWRFVTDRKGKYFQPNQGYIIALDLDELGESADVWANDVENVELYFPSYGTMDNITSSSVVHTLPAHQCNIAARFEGGEDRRVKDSHWNVMSVPTYVNTSSITFANTEWTATRPKFLYEWNPDDNSLTARSGSGFTYHAMHAYMVQYAGNVTWTSSVNVSPSVVARQQDQPQEIEFRIELKQNEATADQTFVSLSSDEQVSAAFDFNYDLCKEMSKSKANIYTMITSMIDDEVAVTKAAGNVLPMTEQTTVVPVGVTVAANDDYTFSIPEGTEGIGVTLIDKERGIRTSLSAVDYTVSLEEGTYNERFVLEISPIHNMPTEIEPSAVSDQQSDVRKLLIDGLLYMVRDGKVYDARGARIE